MCLLNVKNIISYEACRHVSVLYVAFQFMNFKILLDHLKDICDVCWHLFFEILIPGMQLKDFWHLMWTFPSCCSGFRKICKYNGEPLYNCWWMDHCANKMHTKTLFVYSLFTWNNHTLNTGSVFCWICYMYLL